MEKQAKKVLLGMSGGVDSSVSAILLQKAGYEVVGATMRLWEAEDNQTSSAIHDAKRVCEKLGIPHHIIDCREKFKQKVMNQFIACYECAKTPNPCVECNKYLKFDEFYQAALKIGCEYIATGHYAKVEWSEEENQYVLKKSEACQKDQTYFLYNIDKKILPKIIFPLQDFKEKDEIRQIAKEYGLLVANKPDSQEVCFIPDNNYVKFLEQNDCKKQKPGNIILENGTIVGTHKGLIHYTIGQRKGLGISYQEPLYVIRLDKENNQVIVGTEGQLYTDELEAEELNFLMDKLKDKPIHVTAKIRYRAKEAEATVYPMKDQTVRVKFEKPQRAITPGQSIVFYLNDMVVGGGKIKTNINSHKTID